MFPTPVACVLKIFCIPFDDSSWMCAGTLHGRVVGTRAHAIVLASTSQGRAFSRCNIIYDKGFFMG